MNETAELEYSNSGSRERAEAEPIREIAGPQTRRGQNGPVCLVFSAQYRRPARHSAPMSKPGSSSSRPSTSATTPGERPPNSKVSYTPESLRAVWDFIRPQPWVTDNIRQRKSLIILFRSWLASCAALILMLPHRSLTTIGNLCVQSTLRRVCFALTESTLS
jgi:hypothetical protein